MPRWPISAPLRSRNFTANLPVLILFSSNSLIAGMARMKSTTRPPAPSVSASPTASLKRRFHPDSRKRAKKLETAFQRSCTDCQVSASEESIQASMPSQSISRLRAAMPEEPVVQGKSPFPVVLLRDAPIAAATPAAEPVGRGNHDADAAPRLPPPAPQREDNVFSPRLCLFGGRRCMGGQTPRLGGHERRNAGAAGSDPHYRR